MQMNSTKVSESPHHDLLCGSKMAAFGRFMASIWFGIWGLVGTCWKRRRVDRRSQCYSFVVMLKWHLSRYKRQWKLMLYVRSSLSTGLISSCVLTFKLKRQIAGDLGVVMELILSGCYRNIQLLKTLWTFQAKEGRRIAADSCDSGSNSFMRLQFCLARHHQQVSLGGVVNEVLINHGSWFVALNFHKASLNFPMACWQEVLCKDGCE